MQISSSGILIGNEIVPLLSGEVQFWRLDPADWESCVVSLKNMGFPIISTYLSWRRHALTADHYDFSGETDPRLNVSQFMDLCKKHHLWVHLKPGPWICAEEKNGGYPDWLIANKELLAIDSQNAIVRGYNPPFQSPVPSIAHPQYRAYARNWMVAVRETLHDYFYPRGPIVMVQLDNEPSMTFHDQMFEGDYNTCITGEGGIYPRWLQAKHPSQLPYRGAPRSFSDLDSSNPNSLTLWEEFKEFLLEDHITFLKDSFQRDDPLDVLYTVNLNEHAQLSTPNHWISLQHASGLAGYDYYFVPTFNLQHFLNMALAVSYSLTVSPIAWAPELMAGIWVSPGVDEDHPGFTLSDLAFFQSSGFALGLKGANFYMAVNRENWSDAPLTEQGNPGSTYTSVDKLLKTINDIPDFFRLKKRSRIGVIFSHRDAREDYIAGTQPRSMNGLQLGYGYRHFLSVFEALFSMNFNPSIVDFDVKPTDLHQYDILFYSPGETVESDVITGALDFVAEGGTLAIISSKPFSLTSINHPNLREFNLAGSSKYGMGCLESIHISPEDSCNNAICEFKHRLGLNPDISISNSGVFATIQENEGSRVCFVINTNNNPVQCTLSFNVDECERLISVSERGNFHLVKDHEVTLKLDTRSVEPFFLE